MQQNRTVNDKDIETVKELLFQLLNDEFLDETKLAARWKASKKFIQNLRYEGGGPTFTKLGSLVRYSFFDILAYENANKHFNTCYIGTDSPSPDIAEQ